MGKVALSMIVAGHENPEDLRRCLMSAAPHVGGIYVTITSPSANDGLAKVVEEFSGVVKYEPEMFFHKITKKEYRWMEEYFKREPNCKVGDKIFLFDKARNYSMEIIDSGFDWMIWLDVDDVLRHGEKIGEIIETMEKADIDSAFLNYIYQAEFDREWNIQAILIEHLRERIVKLGGTYVWKAPIHETLIEQRPTRKLDFEQVDVVHLSTDTRRDTALKRNLKSLEYSICETKGKDPRPIYYLGKALFDLSAVNDNKEYNDQAMPLFNEYLSGEAKSGWAAERAQCWEYLAEIYRKKGEYNNGVKCLHNAMIEDGASPSTYIALAVMYLMKRDWARALFWVKVSTRVDKPRNTLVTNPRDLQTRALEVVYHVSLNTSKLDEAWASANKLAELLPGNEDMRKRVEFTSTLRRQRELSMRVVELAKYLDKNEPSKLKPLIMSVPTEISNNPIIADMINRVLPPKEWEDDELVIYCGPGASPWNPSDLETGNSFIGGSEEAVIYLSRELVKQGWRVTVYSDVGANEGEYDGVNYIQHYKFNHKDKFNVIVYWRRPGMLDFDHEAKKKYVWCHDIQNQLDWNKDRVDKVTKVIVLSPWHRKNIPEVADDKILISGNGINI